MMNCMLSREQMERLGADCRKLIEQDKAGVDTLTILKEMYCSFYPDKTEDIGSVMADKVIACVEEYEQEVQQAREKPDAWFEEKVTQILAGKESRVQRCNTLYKVRIGLVAAGKSASEGQEVAEDYIREHANKAFTVGEATDELEEKLKEELKEVLENNGMIASALEAFAEGGADENEDVERAVVRYGEDSRKLKAVIAMKAYLETSEEGYLNGVMPGDASLKDITYNVCAGVDTIGIADAVEKGEMEESVATMIVRAIGMVVGSLFAGYLAALVGMAFFAAAGEGLLASIGAVAIIYGFICCGPADFFAEAGATVAAGIKTGVCFGAKCIFTVVKKLFAGVRKLAGLIRDFNGYRKEAASESETVSYTDPVHEGNLDEVVERTPQRQFA